MTVRTLAMSGIAAAVIVGGGLGVSFSQPAPQPPGPQPATISEADAAIGQSTFENKCKGCHEPAVDRAPSREAMAQRTPEQVVTALTAGSMTAMASGLTPDMVRAVATNSI